MGKTKDGPAQPGERPHPPGRVGSASGTWNQWYRKPYEGGHTQDSRDRDNDHGKKDKKHKKDKKKKHKKSRSSSSSSLSQ